MTKLPRQRRQAYRDTCTDRVLVTTSQLAADIAERWSTTKVELYRFLVESAQKFDSPQAMVETLEKGQGKDG